MSTKKKHEEDPEIARVADALSEPKEPETDPSPPIPTRKQRAAARRAGMGTYVVTEACGELHHDGQRYLAGDEIVLSGEQAERLQKHVEPLDGEG
jgi:hypothetical protein